MSRFWRDLFGNDSPVEIEIGPERGTFLLAISAVHSQTNFVGIERSSVRCRRIASRLAEEPRDNVRVVCGDAACVVAACVPSASVAAYHIYFPDPWWKRKHHRRRLLTPEFARELERTLVPGGAIYVVTDVEELYTYVCRSLASVATFRPAESLPARPVRTAFEEKALSLGRRLFHAVMLKSAEEDQRRSA